MTVFEAPLTVINRCAVTVTPAQPMVDWSRPFLTKQEQLQPRTESSLYLIPTFDDELQARTSLQGFHSAIFSAELSLWCRNQQLWPRSRSFELFLDWFSLQFFHLVEDLGAEPLKVQQHDRDFEAQLCDGLG